MLINKYELKKLNHQRNMLLSTNSNNNILIYNSKNRYKQLLNYNNNYYKNQQFSSGYNSENYSNSSNSIANGVTTICASNSFLTNKNMINFYRLSLSHLPLHFLNLQCTCGASNFNNSIDISRLNDALQSSSSSSSIGCFRHSNIENLKSSSPNNKFEEFDVDYDEDEDDDEDEDEDDEEDLDEELNQNTSIDENILNQTATNLNQIETILNNNNKSLEVKKISEANDIRFQFNNCLQRAPGTSHCQHTVRVDIRRVRSLINLSHLQYIYSPNDFIFKEKLGEGFFANVKKIISKQTNKTMVLKELKLSCISNMNNNNSNAYNENLSSSIHSESDSKLDESLNSLARGDFLINYAELNAAYKSFLKEAQVLRNLNHPNVIKLMGIMFTKEKHLNLILEYISGGTLKDIIHNISNILPWKLRVGYAKDIAAAMEYLHSLNIIHRDLKSDNCLVRENGRTVVVADFGLSRINTIQASDNNPTRSIKNRNDSFNLSLFRLPNSYLTSNNNSYVQSPQSSSSATNSFIVAAKRKLKRHNHTRKPRYAVVGNSFSMAPEMLNHQIYDERVDIFSFGIICCEIIGRVQADPDYLPRTSDFGLNVELFRKKYCEADCPKHFIKIAIACCELEPDKRPPFTKTHLWLETILSHLETNNPIPKNLLKNILDQNTKRPLSSLIHSNNENQQLLTNQSKN
jgi:serine/threonine protein kinase